MHAIAPDGAGGDVFCHMHSVVAAILRPSHGRAAFRVLTFRDALESQV
jgi:hypothetical protein